MSGGKTRIEPVPHSTPIDVSEWNLGVLEDACEVLERVGQLAANEALKIALKEYQVSVYFPAEWGPESDGLNGDGSYHDDTVYVGLPLSADECDPPHWRFRLSDLVQSAIDLHKNPVTDRVEDAEGRAAIGRIKRGLTACMAMLDEAVCASPEKQ